MQLEKEKYKFDYEDIQSELDKALGQATRIQKEKDTMKLEADHYQEKYEKTQVSFSDAKQMPNLITTYCVVTLFVFVFVLFFPSFSPHIIVLDVALL